jgi:16S rRNA (adenine1518-N6/adenine1519-N6)-dimethyltransferase
VIAIEIDDLLAMQRRRLSGHDYLSVWRAHRDRRRRTARRTAGAADSRRGQPPYNVAVPVLLHLLATYQSWNRGLVMVQAEVADRLAAQPGSKIYGIPSVKVAWYAAATRAGAVSPTVFWPVPNVESGLVAIKRRPPPETTATREQVFAVVDAAFGQRRKMLRSALAGLAGSSAAASADIAASGVEPESRGEMLEVADFARIAEQIFRH